MNAQEFMTNISVGYAILMVAVVLTALLVTVTSKKKH